MKITPDIIDEAILRYKSGPQKNPPAVFMESAVLVGDIATIVRGSHANLTTAEFGGLLCSAFQLGFESALMLNANHKRMVH